MSTTNPKESAINAIIDTQRRQIETLNRTISIMAEDSSVAEDVCLQLTSLLRKERDNACAQVEELRENVTIHEITLRRIGLLVRAEFPTPAHLIQAVKDLVADRDKWKMKSGAQAIEIGQLRRDFAGIIEQRDQADLRAASAEQRVQAAHQRFQKLNTAHPVEVGQDELPEPLRDQEVITEGTAS